MLRLATTVLATALAVSFAAAQSDDKSVVRLDPALDALVAPDAKVELIKGGFGFTEGPVWVQKGRPAICSLPTAPRRSISSTPAMTGGQRFARFRQPPPHSEKCGR